ncbi:MAG: CNP1-like family protein [Candidatus Accumulibacter sp.]|jgi:hypothetical protein|nr:CNP1-like family protein [Accumulibacter sp.]
MFATLAARRHLMRVFIAFGVLSVSPGAVFSAFLLDDEPDGTPRREAEVHLPAFPEPENLIPFTVGSVRGTHFSIDEKSISVDSDGTIRYSLVVISPSGARNVSFEGMRCATGERRAYAFGRPDRTWSKARSDKWIRIQGGNNSHHVALFADYFCAIGQKTIMTPEDAIRALRYGG